MHGVGTAMTDERAAAGAAIEDFLLEDRTFPPPDAFKESSLVAGTFLYDEADEDYEGFWARQAAELLDWDEDWHTICEWDLPFAKWFVGGQAQRVPQRGRPPRRRRPRRPGRLPLGGRTGRHTHHHLRRPPPRRAALRQRRSRPRRGQGRPGGHLHADGARAARGDAGVRPHRRAALASCSAASARTRSSTASTTPSAGSWSPPTGAWRRGGRRCSSPTSTRPSRPRRASST